MSGCFILVDLIINDLRNNLLQVTKTFPFVLPFQLIIQQTHTMAPVKSLCYDSLKSFLSNQIDKTPKVQHNQNDNSVYEIEDSDDDDDEDSNVINNKVAERKEWSRRESMVDRSSGDEVEKTNRRLTEMLKEKVNFNLF